jgi:hypothetical protein
MSTADSQSLSPRAGPDGFATTRWSLIVAARGHDSPTARDALSHLCAAYWYPLYAYVRRRGHGPDEAQDLTQEFFTRLLERDFLDSVAPERGRLQQVEEEVRALFAALGP